MSSQVDKPVHAGSFTDCVQACRLMVSLAMLTCRLCCVTSLKANKTGHNNAELTHDYWQSPEACVMRSGCRLQLEVCCISTVTAAVLSSPRCVDCVGSMVHVLLLCSGSPRPHELLPGHGVLQRWVEPQCSCFIHC